MSERAAAADTTEYEAFISYTHADSAAAQWLHRALESYVVPPGVLQLLGRPPGSGRRIAPVFLDRAELAATADLDASVLAALARAKCLVVVASRAAAAAPRVAQEIVAFKRLRPERRVLSLIVDGRPNAARRGLDPAEECFPLPLRRAVGADGTIGELEMEPLAADLRGGRRQRRDALLRLVAGVLDVPFDAVVRRDVQRRNRRLAAIAAASTVGMVAAVALAVAALLARAEADRQRLRAEAEATTARTTVEFLSSIFEAPTPESSLGRAITARELLDAGAQRIESELRGAPEVRARLMERVGRAYRLIGALDRAEPLLERAVADFAKLPPGLAQERAVAMTQLGLVYDTLDRSAQARELLREAVRVEAAGSGERRTAAPLLALSFLEMRSSNFAAGEDLVRRARALLAARGYEDHENFVVEVRAAQLYREQARYAEAEKHALLAVEASRRLYGADSPRLGGAYEEVALLYQEMGRLDDALRYARLGLDLAKRMYGTEHMNYAEPLQMIAILHAMQGQLAEAEPPMREVLALRLRHLGPDHTNTGYSYYNLGNLRADRGHRAEALELMRRAQAVWEKAEGPGHPDVAYALDFQAKLLVQLGRATEAEGLAARALAINEKSYGAQHPNVARSLLRLGEAQLAAGRAVVAVQTLARSVAVAETAFGAQHVTVGECLESYARALARAGRAGEAADARRRALAIRAGADGGRAAAS